MKNPINLMRIYDSDSETIQGSEVMLNDLEVLYVETLQSNFY